MSITNKSIRYVKNEEIFFFDQGKETFYHDLENDYHLFIIWEKGRKYEDEILKIIDANFEVLRITYIEWSNDHVRSNFNRFYKSLDDEHINNKPEHVGVGEFVCILVRDLLPEYSYRKTVSGNIELVNKKTVMIKRKARELCNGTFVHSSASPSEFYEQSVLLFGRELLSKIISNEGCKEKIKIKMDLQGASGWEGFDILFDTLEFCSKYIVLRNFKYLPFDFFGNDQDVDILCENISDFIAASNGKILKITSGGVKLLVNISGKEVPFDVRFVGDGYYDVLWQVDMLDRRVRNDSGIYRPRADDYFFSLLYHSVLQKEKVKTSYIEVFNELSKKLDFDFFNNKSISNNKYIAEVIEGYLKANGYCFSLPKDQGVYINYSVLKYIDKKVGGRNSQRSLRVIKVITPRFFIRLVPTRIKVFVRKILV